MVGLGSDPHGLSEGFGAGREDHKLLESELVASVRATVDNVEGRDGKNVWGLDTSEVSKVLVERNALDNDIILALYSTKSKYGCESKPFGQRRPQRQRY